MGVHPEDVVFSPAWPALCAALPACLLPMPPAGEAAAAAAGLGAGVGIGAGQAAPAPAEGGVLWPPGEGGVRAACGAAAWGGMRSGSGGKGGGAAAAVAAPEDGGEVVGAAAELVEQLARQCVASSPLHVVQLLQALQPFLLAGLQCPGEAAGLPGAAGWLTSQGAHAHSRPRMLPSHVRAP